MDVMERCRRKVERDTWERQVRDAALSTSLTFRQRWGMQYERDAVWLKPTSETGGLPHYIEFARGKYDNFAVPVVRCDDDGTPVSVAYATDEFYFSRLCLLALEYGDDRVWRDCQRLYAMTTDAVSAEVLAEIDRISREYGDDEGLAFNTMMHLYYGMIAEEHYQRLYADGTVKRTKMGKLMKMHALHRMLVEHDSVSDAARECVCMDPKQVLRQASGMGLVRTVTWSPYSSRYDDPTTLPVVGYGDRKEV